MHFFRELQRRSVSTRSRGVDFHHNNSAMSLLFPLAVLLVEFHDTSSAPNRVFDRSRVYTAEEYFEAYQHELCHQTPGCDQGRHQTRGCLAEDDLSLASRIVNTEPTDGCSSLKGQVFWPKTGTCVTLLQKGPCDEGKHVVIDTTTGDPTCDWVKCPRAGEARMNGECHPTSDTTPCPGNLQLVANEVGDGECDCPLGMAFHTPTNLCYRPYTRGPCPEGYVIKVSEQADGTGRGACMTNVCTVENMVPMDAQCRENSTGICYRLNTQGPCHSGILILDLTYLIPACVHVSRHNLFAGVPTVRCSRGSRRDMAGRCRRIFGPRRATMPTARPGGYPGGICPKGFSFSAGTCYKLPAWTAGL